MNNKAFTLIELIMVFVLLGIVMTITVPMIGSVISGSKESVSKEQIRRIERVAETYMTSSTNSVNLPKENETYEVTIEELKKSGLLSNEKILNPKDKTRTIDGCVMVKYENNKYKYEYKNNDECEQ